MAFKIAVASTDGKVINQHFGRAERFLIVSVSDDGAFQLESVRNTTAACVAGEHSNDGLAKSVSILSDCSYCLASQIGPGAEYALSKQGITPFAIANYIDTAIEKIIAYHNRIDFHTKNTCENRQRKDFCPSYKNL